MTKTSHGTVEDGILVKRGSQVVKFWKYNGYAIPILELLKVKGVKLYTKYDGVLFADKATFDKHAVPHLFGNEHQLVLEVKFWQVLREEPKVKNLHPLVLIIWAWGYVIYIVVQILEKAAR